MKILTFIIRRLLLMGVVMFGVASIVFFISRIIPADPVGAILGGNAPVELVDEMREALGLNQPLHIQFLQFIKGLLQGDLGKSLITKREVLSDLMEFFPATLELSCVAMMITIFLGILMGAYSAVKRNHLSDHALRIFSIMGVSIPVFWLGLILSFALYYKLGWLPGGGRLNEYIFLETITGFVLIDSLITYNFEALFNGLWHLLLPAFVLGYASTASVARIMRASMLDVLRQDYIRCARSKGLGKRLVIYRHALKNALIPVVTVIGISFGDLLSGAVLTETIFSWPGLGRYIVNAMLKLDYPAVTGGTLFIALIYSMANLLVDISYAILDPRMEN